jgi:hypothetical protein
MSINEFPRTGVFTIGTGAPGAPQLRATLNVMAATSEVSGEGTFSKIENPPIRFTSRLQGNVHVLVFGGKAEQIYALHGTALAPLPGASHITSLVINLDGIWGTHGNASYAYFNDTPIPVKYENQPVKVQWLLAE